MDMSQSSYFRSPDGNMPIFIGTPTPASYGPTTSTPYGRDQPSACDRGQNLPFASPVSPFSPPPNPPFVVPRAPTPNSYSVAPGPTPPPPPGTPDPIRPEADVFTAHLRDYTVRAIIGFEEQFADELVPFVQRMVKEKSKTALSKEVVTQAIKELAPDIASRLVRQISYNMMSSIITGMFGGEQVMREKLALLANRSIGCDKPCNCPRPYREPDQDPYFPDFEDEDQYCNNRSQGGGYMQRSRSGRSMTPPPPSRMMCNRPANLSGSRRPRSQPGSNNCRRTY